MKQFRPYGFTAADLARVGRDQEPVIIAVGRAQKGRLYILPIATWGGIVRGVYETNSTAWPRITTSTSEGGMSETALMDVLLNQVGEDGRIAGGTVYVVTHDNEDAADAVPANAYWRAQVRARGEGRDE